MLKYCFFLILILVLILLGVFLLYRKPESFNTNLNKSLKLSYVITLPNRKNYIERIMPGFGLNPAIFPATLKKSLRRDSLVKSNFLNPESKLNMGQIACHYSHIRVLKTFLKTSEPMALIFEDDIEPAKKNKDYYNLQIKNILAHVPHNFDLIYLGRCYDRCQNDQNISPGLVRCFWPLCRHSYIVSRRGALSIINLTLPLKIQGDNTIANLIKRKRLIAYAAKPALFHQNRKQLGSNLNNNDTLRECW